MRRAARLTQERVHQMLIYEPLSGVFLWRVSPGGGIKAGDEAGCVDSNSYRRIRIDGLLWQASVIAWLYMTGEWPSEIIDHRDRNRTNDIFTNLRKADQFKNGYNRPAMKNNTSGFKGVDLHVKGSWRARIRVNGKSKTLGYFPTPEAAYAAYCNAGAKLHGDFFNGAIQ